MITTEFVADLIRAHDRGRPRSRQVALGPSQLGSPCARKVLYSILRVPPAASTDVSLAAWVGTGVHAQFESALSTDPEWLTEVPVSVPVGDGAVVVRGSMDAYHIPSRAVVDWKTVGPSQLQKVRSGSPERYLSQISLYALGATLLGLPVESVALVYVPRNGQLSDIVVDAVPVSEVWPRAESVIRRYEALLAVASVGVGVLSAVPIADDCRFCPWWSPGLRDVAQGCDGYSGFGRSAGDEKEIKRERG